MVLPLKFYLNDQKSLRYFNKDLFHVEICNIKL